MTVKVTVTYTPNEIETITKTLLILQQFNKVDQEHTKEIDERVDKAFECLADLLCLDPEGERIFIEQGW